MNPACKKGRGRQSWRTPILGFVAGALWLSSCATRSPQPPPTGGVAAAPSLQQSQYHSPASSRKLPFTPLPLVLQGDTMAARRFEAGRRVGHQYLRSADKQVYPPAPKLPQALVPADSALQTRAASAYESGFRNQIQREKEPPNYVANGLTGLAILGAYFLLIVLAMMAFFSLLFGGLRFPGVGSP